MVASLIKLSRKNKQIFILWFDFIAIIGCLFAAFSIRLGYFYYPIGFYGDEKLLIVIFTAPLVALPIFFHFELYRTVIRFVSFRSIWRIIQAVSLYAILWGLIAFMTANWEAFPRSVIIINWILVIIVIGGSRLIARWFLSYSNINNGFLKKKSVLIYGAGTAGRQLCRALKESEEYSPIAFIDDSSELCNVFINGLQVFSKSDLEGLIEKNDVKEVLLAMPSSSRGSLRKITSFLENFPVVVRTLPSVSELAQGKVKINDLLEIDTGDLLGRESVKANVKLLKTNISNKAVLISGAGGSIGSELCRQILYLQPKKIILYEISESSLYQIDQELLDEGLSNIDIIPVIGSITDKARLTNICKSYGVHTIYHAAAYKHVPLVESNQSQGILNNAIGTLTAGQAAIESSVETFVLISTDKAVRPTSVMGATKRIAELVLQALAKQSHNTCFTMVRFGNVLESSGSVIPLFKKQIKAGGPITVTHLDVVRYFMTIPEAVELVIQAGAMAKGGEVFLLDMGEPISIDDLAKKMIKLSGLQLLDESHPNGDIEIQYTGLRPGEKLYEELLIDGEFSLTENKLIMQAKESMIDWEKLEPMLIQIKKAAIDSDTENIYKLLIQIVPQFNPQSTRTDIKE